MLTLSINTLHNLLQHYFVDAKTCNAWKDCKLLGSLLSTVEDIKRRKGLAIAAMNNMKHIFYGKRDIKVKLRAFNCYVSSIFLYNSELWSIIDNRKFHRCIPSPFTTHVVPKHALAKNNLKWIPVSNYEWNALEYCSNKTTVKLVWPYDPTAVQHSGKGRTTPRS